MSAFVSPHQAAAIQLIVMRGGSIAIGEVPVYTIEALKKRGLVVWAGTANGGGYVLTDDGKRAAVRIANDARRAAREESR